MSLLYSCPKFSSCSVPVCPMDTQWRRTAHLRSEPVCLWLREWSKPGGPARVRERLQGEMAEAVAVAYSELTLADAHPCNGAGEIRRVLQASSLTGSTLEAGKRLRAAK